MIQMVHTYDAQNMYKAVKNIKITYDANWGK